MSLTAIVALLQSALMLLTLAQSAPNLPQSFRDNATAVAHQAISQATLALASNVQTSGTPAVPTPAPVQYQPPVPTQTNPAPVPAPEPSSPVPTQISIQSNVCNLASSNLKTEYILDEDHLLANGNIDGRIFMNAYILDQEGRNYFTSNPSPTMTITTSNHSNDKVINGSGATGPCGFHYPYQFYATERGTYTITYSVLGLTTSVTIVVK